MGESRRGWVRASPATARGNGGWCWVLGRWSPLVALGLWLAIWVVAASVAQVVQRLKAAPQPTLFGKLRAQPWAWYGMTVAHVGVAVFIVGVTIVRGYETERDLRMAPGDRTTIGGYEFTFLGTRELPGPNYTPALASRLPNGARITIRRR